MFDSDDDEGVEMEDNAFTYADTARNDNPDYWQRGIDVEVWVSPERACAEAGDTPMQGKWEHGGRVFDKTDQVFHAGYVKVRGTNPFDNGNWYPMEEVRRRLVTPGRDSAGNNVHRKTRAAPSTVKSARIGPRMRGVIADGLFDPERHRAWMCLLWYARISTNGQSLDKFLLAPFLSLIPDETTRARRAERRAGAGSRGHSYASTRRSASTPASKSPSR